MSTSLEHALDHIAVSRRKNNKAWAWQEAQEAAKIAGVEVYPDPEMSCRNPYPDLKRLEKDVRAALEPDIVIITRHTGMVQWLAQNGIVGEVISHVTDAESQVRGKIVYGALPLHLAAVAARVVSVDMPNLPAELRGQDLTPAQMDEAGATMRAYMIQEIKPLLDGK